MEAKNNIHDKPALLVTGTVIPNSNFVSHTDINQRAEEYYTALLFYLEKFPAQSIYFLENSFYDFTADERFSKLFKDGKITLLKFPVSDKFNEGKGYQEFEMLDKAVDELKGTYASFVKITGRYRVLNLDELLKNKKTALIIDCHKKPKVAQTNVFYCETSFYLQNMKELYKLSDDSKNRFIEHVVYHKIAQAQLWKHTSLFPVNPLIRGVSGSYGGTLNRNKYKLMLRNLERKLYGVLGIKQFLFEY